MISPYRSLIRTLENRTLISLNKEKGRAFLKPLNFIKMAPLKGKKKVEGYEESGTTKLTPISRVMY